MVTERERQQVLLPVVRPDPYHLETCAGRDAGAVYGLQHLLSGTGSGRRGPGPDRGRGPAGRADGPARRPPPAGPTPAAERAPTRTRRAPGAAPARAAGG